MRYAVGGADSRRPVKARERLRDADGSAGVGSGFKKACGVGMGAWGVAAAVRGCSPYLSAAALRGRNGIDDRVLGVVEDLGKLYHSDAVRDLLTAEIGGYHVLPTDFLFSW